MITRTPDPLESREPTVADLRYLCRALNARQARYIVIGGFAMAAIGYNRRTMDIDLLVDVTGTTRPESWTPLPICPTAPRVRLSREKSGNDGDQGGDEIVVDLMQSACGIDYARASTMLQVRDLDGVEIPFAAAELLWRMKRPTHREKDAADLLFLSEWFRSRGIIPPEIE
jgi:hypothetical protein